jgi:hypothetical protein
MNLMRLTLQTPTRDEQQIINGWTDRKVLINPRNVESATFNEELGKVIIAFTSQRTSPIKESVEYLEEEFGACT